MGYGAFGVQRAAAEPVVDVMGVRQHLIAAGCSARVAEGCVELLGEPVIAAMIAEGATAREVLSAARDVRAAAQQVAQHPAIAAPVPAHVVPAPVARTVAAGAMIDDGGTMESPAYDGPNTWDDRIADTSVLGLVGLVVVLNAVFTIAGVTSWMSARVDGHTGWTLGLVLGVILHLIISRIELAYLTLSRLVSWGIVVLVPAMVLDGGTTAQGFRALLAQFLPDLVTGVPDDVLAWPLVLIAPTSPASTATATLLIAAVLISTCSEKLLRIVWRRYHRRHGDLVAQVIDWARTRR